jgi:hypothetical protein
MLVQAVLESIVFLEECFWSKLLSLLEAVESRRKDVTAEMCVSQEGMMLIEGKHTC